MKKTGRVKESAFWRPLWGYYPTSPSITLCRVPELEYASTIEISGRTLDHCCGDGRFASLAWPGSKLSVGCDIDKPSTEAAFTSGMYDRVDVCDVSNRLPYEDESFDLVFNNSGLEHIQNLQATLSEIGRVLSKGGTFAFNVLNHRYFEWWSLSEEQKWGYRRWQPFFHALSLSDWQARLAEAGLEVASVAGYFDRKASIYLSLLDCSFSSVYIAGQSSRLVERYLAHPHLFCWYWRLRLRNLRWRTESDEGAGYFIKARRV
jgi:SAM-dependent methyltransferase